MTTPDVSSTHLLRITGVRDPAASAAVAAALHAHDPNCRISGEWRDDLVEISSASTPETLVAVLRDAGFVAIPLQARPRPTDVRGIAGLAGRTVLFAVLGLVGGAILGLVAGIANDMFSPECHSAHDEGACAMGIVTFPVGFAVIGAMAASIVTVVRGALRLYRARGG
jgi:hypothetical protein